LKIELLKDALLHIHEIVEKVIVFVRIWNHKITKPPMLCGMDTKEVIEIKEYAQIL